MFSYLLAFIAGVLVCKFWPQIKVGISKVWNSINTYFKLPSQ